MSLNETIGESLDIKECLVDMTKIISTINNPKNGWCVDTSFIGDSSFSVVYFNSKLTYRYDIYYYNNSDMKIFKEVYNEENDDYVVAEEYCSVEGYTKHTQV